MDRRSGEDAGNPVVVTGFGWETSPETGDYLVGRIDRIPDDRLSHDCRPVEFLKKRKTMKFMSKQDRLALSAAGKALSASGAEVDRLRSGCGVFMSVGHIPFQRDEAERICTLSTENGRFSMKAFSTKGYDDVNPILAFACLPNMPAHHISANFDLQGEYFITYPGAAQLYTALREAVERLAEGQLEFVLLGGVADQNNFLVENHFRKTDPEGRVRAVDAAGFMMLERADHAAARNRKPLVRLRSLDQAFVGKPRLSNRERSEIEFGPAQLPLELFAFSKCSEGRFEHLVRTRDHRMRSCWESP